MLFHRYSTCSLPHFRIVDCIVLQRVVLLSVSLLTHKNCRVSQVDKHNEPHSPQFPYMFHHLSTVGCRRPRWVLLLAILVGFHKNYPYIPAGNRTTLFHLQPPCTPPHFGTGVHKACPQTVGSLCLDQRALPHFRRLPQWFQLGKNKKSPRLRFGRMLHHFGTVDHRGVAVLLGRPFRRNHPRNLADKHKSLFPQGLFLLHIVRSHNPGHKTHRLRCKVRKTGG